MKKYLVRNGFTFVGTDNKVVGGGAEIELEEDVAQFHLHKLEPVAPVQASAPKKAAAPKAPAATAPADPAPPAEPVPPADPAPLGGEQSGGDATAGT